LESKGPASVSSGVVIAAIRVQSKDNVITGGHPSRPDEADPTPETGNHHSDSRPELSPVFFANV
jgi:hypothetical protein